MSEPLTGADENDDDPIERLPKAKKRKKKKPLPKPTLADVKSMCDRAVTFWSARDDRMDRDHRLYRLSQEIVGLPGTQDVVILNTPYVVVEKAAALMGKQKPSLDIVAPVNRLRDKAQIVEDYGRYAISSWDEDWSASGHNDFQRDLGHFLALRGWAAARERYDPDAADGENPVHVTLFDPRQVYPMWGVRDLKYVVHRYETTIEEVISDFPKAERLFTNQQDRTEIITVTGYYDGWWHCVYADAGDVKPLTAHKYGRVPWRIGIGQGSPIRMTPPSTQSTLLLTGYTTSDTSWTEDVGVSLFHGARDVYNQLNRLLSMLMTNISKSADPPVAYYIDPANPEEPEPLKFDAGAVNYLLYDKERVEPLKTSPSPTDMNPLIDALRMSVELGSLPIKAWSETAASGLAQTLMTEQVEDVLYPYIDAMRQMYEGCIRDSLDLIAEFHTEPIPFYTRDPRTGKLLGSAQLEPEDIDEVGTTVLVSFRQIGMHNKAMLSQLAVQLTDAKLISLETARDEYLGLENPQRENERVLSDLVYMDEDARKALTEVAIKRTDPDVYEVFKKARAALPPAGPPGMPPGMPGPEGPPGPPPPPGGLPPDVMPPMQQAIMNDPNALLNQAMASAIGGASQGPLTPPGIPGIGGQMPPISPNGVPY